MDCKEIGENRGGGVSVYDFMLQNSIHFYSSLNIPFTISLSLIVMTLQFFLIPFVVVQFQ